MLLHIGDDEAVSLPQVVAIIDRKTMSTSQATKEFIQLAKAEGRLLAEIDDDTKSFVITDKGILPSPISSTTLARRSVSFL